MPDETNVETSPDAGFSEPLSRWQRIAACAVGLCSAGAGGASVFLTTNQAGSVALLGVGAGFLIMAVNGTPIIRAKISDNELIMAPKRRKIAEQALSEPPEEAIKTLDVLKQIDPGARTDPAVQRAMERVYEAEVFAALTRAAVDGPELAIGRIQVDLGFDLVIRSDAKAIDVAIKYTSRPDALLPSRLISQMYNLALGRETPLMVVTNWRLSNQISVEAKTIDPEGKRVQFVRWSDQQDDRALTLALNRLLEASEVTRKKRTPPGGS